MKTSLPKELLREKYEKLPQALREAIASVDTADIILSTGRAHKLPIDKIGKLAEEVGLVMGGLVSTKDFIPDLVESLGLPTEEVKVIALEINEKIFLPIRNFLKDMHGEKWQDDLAADTGKIGSVPPPPPSEKPASVLQTSRPAEVQKKPEPLIISPVPMSPPRGSSGQGTPRPSSGQVDSASSPQVVSSDWKPLVQEVKPPVPPAPIKPSPVIGPMGFGRTTINNQQITNNKQETTIGNQRITNDKQQITISNQRITNNEPRTTNGEQKTVMREIRPAPSVQIPQPPRSSAPQAPQKVTAPLPAAQPMARPLPQPSPAVIPQPPAPMQKPVIQEIKLPQAQPQIKIQAPQPPQSYKEIKEKADKELEEFLKAKQAAKPPEQKPSEQPTISVAPQPPKTPAPEKYDSDPYKEPIE